MVRGSVRRLLRVGVGLATVGVAVVATGAELTPAGPRVAVGAVREPERLADDRVAVRLARDGLRAVVGFLDGRPDLVPRESPPTPRLLGPEPRETLRRTWQRALDYVLALDAIGSTPPSTESSNSATGERAFVVRHAAFVAQYRWALELLDRLDRDPGLVPLLGEAVPELGLAKGAYARLRFRFLNVLRATEFTALGLLARQHEGTAAPELRAAIAEDREAIWRMGRGRGPVLTLKNAARIVQDAGHAAWLPAQAGLVHVAATRTLWRPGRALITPAQLDVLVPRIEPGDILLVRRHWYLSDLGLPGFWPHVALYVGLPEERRRLAADPAVRAWVRERGQPDGDLEALLRAAHPVAYASHGERAHGRARRVLEAISAGVGFGSLEQLAADSLAVLRPRLPAIEKAAALVRAFGYPGRPYDFEFDFRTDAALVCSEVIYKAYEPGAGIRGLRWAVPEILGRPVLPPNEMVRQFDAAYGTADQQLDLVVFLDGEERAGNAIERGADAFRQSWRRPKWQLLVQP